MIVWEVRLENIKSFGSPAEIVRFARGVNAVSGPNGAGKSTVLEAIGATLFQHLPYRHESFVREGESTGSITVVVESSVDGRTYEVVRKVGRSATHHVYDPDILQFVARGEGDVGRWLRLHLQVEAEIDLKSLFVDSVGPPQGTLTAAFLETPQTRKGKFNRLLRVDDYETAYRNLVTLESAIDADRTAVDRTVATLEAQAKGRADLESRRIERRDEQVILARRLGDLTAEREGLDTIIATFDSAELRLREATAAGDVASERATYAQNLLRRAEQDHQTAVQATEAVARHRGGRDRYHLAEVALAALEDRRRTRDSWRATSNEWALKQSGLQGKLNGVVDSIADGERARGEIADLEQRIPLQDAADARLQAARLARIDLDENRKQLEALRKLVDRAETRSTRAELALADATAGRAVADELPQRQIAYQAAANRLAQIDQATGSVKALQESLPPLLRRAEDLRGKLTILDDQLRLLDGKSVLVLDIQTIEAQHGQVVDERAAAISHLKLATDNRIQVEGGLCPLLNEWCRNIRPGITLEGHFDGEIERWRQQIDRLSGAYSAVDERLRNAKKQVEETEKITRLGDERLAVAAQLKDADDRLAESRSKLRDSLAVARERPIAEGAAQVAVAALQEARDAVQVVGRITALARDAVEAREDYVRRQSDLDTAQATVTNADEIDAEMASAAAACNEVGSPREKAAHRRPAVDRLPGLYDVQRRLQALIEAAEARIGEANEQLEQFGDLDRSIDEQRRAREETRFSYEAYVAAEPAAALLAGRTSALREAETAADAANAELQRVAGTIEDAAKAYDLNAHQACRARRAEIGTSLGETRAQLASAAREEASLDRELAAIRRLELELAVVRKHRDGIDAERQLAGSMRAAIRSAGPEITRQLLGRISRTAAQINAEILNQSGIEVEWTSDYDIVTRRQGETRGFAQLSGGEQMAAGLAVRMAAMRHLSRIRFVFLDEPTAHLDETRRSNLGDQVQRLQGFDQLVVISHDDTFDGLFGHVVRIANEDGRSRVLDEQ
jgi:exonuclease SbcC